MTEDKIKTENDTFALKRDYKHAVERLEEIKKDTAEILNLKEKAQKELDEARTEILKVKNEISDEKLAWTTHRHTELKDIEDKQGEVKSILDREQDLNKKEQKINDTLEKNTQVLNDKRQIELTLKRERTALEVKERELESEKVILQDKENKLATDKQDFKSKVAEIFNSIETL